MKKASSPSKAAPATASTTTPGPPAPGPTPGGVAGDKNPPGAVQESFIAASMYHSAVDSLFGGQQSSSVAGESGVVDPGLLDQQSTTAGHGQRSSLPDLAQRLLVASEKQISAKLSVTEVLLSLSSRGEGGGDMMHMYL